MCVSVLGVQLENFTAVTESKIIEGKVSECVAPVEICTDYLGVEFQGLAVVLYSPSVLPLPEVDVSAAAVCLGSRFDGESRVIVLKRQIENAQVLAYSAAIDVGVGCIRVEIDGLGVQGKGLAKVVRPLRRKGRLKQRNVIVVRFRLRGRLNHYLSNCCRCFQERFRVSYCYHSHR